MDITTLEKEEVLLKLGRKQNYLHVDKEVDLERVSLFILQEYRMGYYGRITLDRCDVDE